MRQRQGWPPIGWALPGFLSVCSFPAQELRESAVFPQKECDSQASIISEDSYFGLQL